MQQFLGEKYVDLVRVLEKAAGSISQKPDHIDHALPAIAARLTEAQGLLKELDLLLSLRYVQRMMESLSLGAMTIGELSQGLGILNGRIQDEMEASLFMYIPRERAVYYNQKELFGAAVAEHFPSAIADIEHAGKCLAFGEATACVFHLMRVMEVGLKSLAKMLGIPYAPSWESYLKQINDKVTAKHKTKGVRWKKDEPFFRDVAGNLMTVKIAWRNPTMHIVRKYDIEEAEEIFKAVRGFMSRLAARLSG